jgi:threonine/homoserine/homoserine lactone efflux protein
MTPGFLLKGILIGFSIAAPVGPIGLLCIRRSLVDGRAAGLATGLGAATADAAYGCIAGFGLTAISNFLVSQKVWLGFVGGLVLCYLGVRTFVARPSENPETISETGLSSAYLSTLVLTLTNPMTILSFVAVFAGLGLAGAPDYFNASLLVGGVFTGSAIWWLLLSSGTAFFRSRLDAERLQIVNRISGGILVAFGIYAVASCFAK